MSSASAHDVGKDVRNVDHRLAGLAEPPDQREQPFGLARGQRRGRLVEDDDRRIELQRLGDLDQLAFARRQPLERRVGQRDRDRPRSRSSRVRSARLARSMSASGPKRRRGKASMKMFSAIVRLLKRLSSWWMKAMPLARRRRPGCAGA